MENTGRYDLPLLMPSQAQKHITHNEALTLVDGLLHPAIKTFDDTSPPVGAVVDDLFYVAPGATGDWFGQSGKLALFTTEGWRFAPVGIGMIAFDRNLASCMIFDGAAWQPLASTISVETATRIGVNTAADNLNKLSVKSNAALFNAIDMAGGGTGDVRVAINKELPADTGSLVYQSGFSGRAEIGLAGDDDFHVKVSPDGSAWFDAISVNRTNGQVTLGNNSVANAALADMPTSRLKGRIAAGTGDPEDLTATQATALLDTFSSANKGLAPGSGGGTVNFLRADGTWAAPSGGGSITWGGISGTLSAQTDLQTALNAKLNASAVSSFGLTLVDDADGASARATLGLGTLATQSGTFSGTSSGTNSGDQTITLTGNVTGSGSGSFSTTIAAGVVSNAMLANVATARIKGRVTAASGAVEDLTGMQATTLLDVFTSALKGLAPASGGGTTNFLRADGTWAAPAGGGTVDPLDLAQTGVAAPALGNVRLFRMDNAGRQMPAFIGPSGMDTTIQPFLATNKVARWNPAGNVTTTPIIDGFTAAFTTLGTATARSVATTNYISRLRRFGYVSAATAAAFCGHYATVAQWTIGDGAGLGGFHYVCRFVPADAASVSGARMFVGLRNAVSAPTNVEPNTLTNSIGVAQLSTSTNLHIVFGGSVAQTAIDLGASFPANGASTAAYELQLFASPGNQTIGYKVTRLDTGQTASGTLSGAVGTQAPAATTFLAHTAWRTNNATLLACGLDIVGVYLETDN